MTWKSLQYLNQSRHSRHLYYETFWTAAKLGPVMMDFDWFITCWQPILSSAIYLYRLSHCGVIDIRDVVSINILQID